MKLSMRRCVDAFAALFGGAPGCRSEQGAGELSAPTETRGLQRLHLARTASTFTKKVAAAVDEGNMWSPERSTWWTAPSRYRRTQLHAREAFNLCGWRPRASASISRWPMRSAVRSRRHYGDEWKRVGRGESSVLTSPADQKKDTGASPKIPVRWPRSTRNTQGRRYLVRNQSNSYSDRDRKRAGMHQSSAGYRLPVAEIDDR